MTREEILNMPAGREMDIKIALNIMGYKWRKAGDIVDYGIGEQVPGGVRLLSDTLFNSRGITATNIPHYSTDIAAAWEVVEKMAKTQYVFPEIRHSHSWVCRIWRNNPAIKGDFGSLAEVYADTAPLAICRAALLAVLDK